MSGADIQASMEYALQAAESSALEEGKIPGYSLMAEYALRFFRSAGFRVVRPPKPDHVARRPSEVDAAWSTYPGGDPVNDAKWPGPDRVAVDGDEIEFGGNNLLPDEAEALGLALLAASGMARAAEATG